jgi:hypothetical protein
MNMAQKNLIQRIGIAGIGLGMLVQSMIPSNAIAQDNTGQFYNKRTGQYEVARPLPDVSGCEYLGEKQIDKVDTIPGAETTIKRYKCGENNITITYGLPNGKIYGFGVREGTNEYMFSDYENDSNFEQDTKKFKIDDASYGY